MQAMSNACSRLARRIGRELDASQPSRTRAEHGLWDALRPDTFHKHRTGQKPVE